MSKSDILFLYDYIGSLALEGEEGYNKNISGDWLNGRVRVSGTRGSGFDSRVPDC